MKLLHVFAVVITAGGLGLAAPARAVAQEPEAGVSTLAPDQDPAVQLAQQQGSNVPQPVQTVVESTSSAVQKYRIGADFGVGLDPELIMFGAHGAFGPIYKSNITFRPGIEFGIGELTTLFGINLDVLYQFHQDDHKAWAPYVGTGPNFTLSHQGFSTTDTEHVDTEGGSSSSSSTDKPSRFNFGDTNFDAGWNFLAGARKNKMFFEMKATAYGVSNVRLLFGFDF